MKNLAAVVLISFLPGWCLAQGDPTVLKPQKAEPAAPRHQSVRPAPDDPGHFVARTKHLLELVRKYPASKEDPWFKVNGVQFWPASPISREALKMLEDERGAFSPLERDQAVRCGVPPDMPPDTQVVLLEAPGSRLAMPVFLSPDGKELHYLELSLDQPGAPVLLVITGYDGLAVRITTSSATRLTAVHLHTYYPNVVLGVDPKKVTQQYYGRGPNNNCQYGFSDGVQGLAVIQRLRHDPSKAIRYKTDGQDRIAIGAPQPVKRAPPMLGTFLDLEMPIPNNYGIVVLADLGYIRPVRLKTEGGRGSDAFEVLKPFRIPSGLAGSHSVTFFLTRESPVPSGELAHSSMVRQVQ
jgi:hypothetical protein